MKLKKYFLLLLCLILLLPSCNLATAVPSNKTPDPKNSPDDSLEEYVLPDKLNSYAARWAEDGLNAFMTEEQIAAFRMANIYLDPYLDPTDWFESDLITFKDEISLDLILTNEEAIAEQLLSTTIRYSSFEAKIRSLYSDEMAEKLLKNWWDNGTIRKNEEDGSLLVFGNFCSGYSDPPPHCVTFTFEKSEESTDQELVILATRKTDVNPGDMPSFAPAERHDEYHFICRMVNTDHGWVMSDGSNVLRG